MSRNYTHQIQILIQIRIPIQRRTPDLRLLAVWLEELRIERRQRVS